MRRLIPALFLLLAACQTGEKPNAAVEAGPIAGAKVETTSLDAPKTDDKAAAKALAKALATLPDPMAAGTVDASLETGSASLPAATDKAADEPAVAADAATDATTETPPEPQPDAPDETLDDALAAAEAEPEIPAALKSPEQRKCERQNGQYVAVDGQKDLRTCVRRTRDANKSCNAAGDCQGKCLARSRTCAPIDPLLGCNEILTDYGQAITECIQ